MVTSGEHGSPGARGRREKEKSSKNKLLSINHKPAWVAVLTQRTQNTDLIIRTRELEFTRQKQGRRHGLRSK